MNKLTVTHGRVVTVMIMNVLHPVAGIASAC